MQPAPVPSLVGLPTELKEQIARFVDPIGLFSLRLIHNDFRSIIQPQKQQYIEHLLALECRVKYGGPPLPFRHLYGRPVWARSTLLATRSRWACTGCVRLLPYYHFQIRFLAEVIWRKPMPRSPAAKIITSWEPGHARAVTLTPLPADDGRSIQDQFGFTYERFWWLLKPAMNLACGTSRHHRKCNECLFRDGIFNSATISSDIGMFGTERFPIISIENHLIRSPVDRYFPGILDIMQQGRPVPSFRQGSSQTSWILWMARCPRCAKWQELRAFRYGAGGPGFRAWEPTLGRLTWEGLELTPEIFDKACCNACFIEQNGRSALAEYLFQWFMFLVRQQPNDVHCIAERDRDYLVRWALERGEKPW